MHNPKVKVAVKLRRFLDFDGLLNRPKVVEIEHVVSFVILERSCLLLNLVRNIKVKASIILELRGFLLLLLRVRDVEVEAGSIVIERFFFDLFNGQLFVVNIRRYWEIKVEPSSRIELTLGVCMALKGSKVIEVHSLSRLVVRHRASKVVEVIEGTWLCLFIFLFSRSE
jgi:hypothetical protein